MLEELDSFKDKTGKFSPAHLWPRLDDAGNIISATLKPAWCFWNGCSILNAAPTLAPFACVQTAQIGSNSISERGHKSYKFIMDKQRVARLEGRVEEQGKQVMLLTQTLAPSHVATAAAGTRRRQRPLTCARPSQIDILLAHVRVLELKITEQQA